jgi:hypothetical protein
MRKAIPIDEAIDAARHLLAHLETARLTTRDGGSRDPGIERRIALEIGGAQLRDLAKRRQEAEARAKAARAGTPSIYSTTTFASARLYGEARRKDREVKRLAQRARQARAKFKLVYATILASDAFAARLDRERRGQARPHPCADSGATAVDGAMGGVEAVIDVWLTRKSEGTRFVAFDPFILRDLAPVDAARKLVAHMGDQCAVAV